MGRLRGLQAKMTATYVLVTAAAVLLVEAAAIGLLVPSAVSASDLKTRVQSTAAALAQSASTVWAKKGSAPTGAEFPLGSAESPVRPGQAQADSAGGIVVNRTTSGYTPGQAPAPAAVLVATDGTVLATSYPAQYPIGSRPSLPYDPAQQSKAGGISTTDGGKILWAVVPVTSQPTPLKSVTPPKPSPAGPTPGSSADASPSSGSPTAAASPAVAPSPILGTVFVQVPAAATLGGARDLGPSLRAATVVLILLLPVGAVFGYLASRRTVRRLRQLEASAARVAAGDLDSRVDVAGSDELAGLEAGFNAMAEQLQGSLTAERQLSGAAARATERARIARELHDSVSQDVFSLGLLAGGLRKALPEESPLRPEVEAMERTSRRALREMQALLLELRPVSLDDVGLPQALEELCRAYRSRLGIDIHADVGDIDATAPVEHGVLRIAQEALANAVKHADPTSIWLTVHQDDGVVQVRVRDDGAGFDPEPGAGQLGLGLGLQSMRERVSELGGELALESEPGAGTTLSVIVPAGAGR